MEPRNTPTVINAVFNSRNFWDGRAQPLFNCVNHLGEADANARVYRADNPGSLAPVRVLIDNSSLASQAVAPPLDSMEMSAGGRAFADLSEKLSALTKAKGRKVRTLRPLGKQMVHPDDSVLGPLSARRSPD